MKFAIKDFFSKCDQIRSKEATATCTVKEDIDFLSENIDVVSDV